MKINIILILIILGTMTHSHAGDEPEVPSREEWAQAMLNAVGNSGPRLNQMIRALAAYCASSEETYFTGLDGNCDGLYIAGLNGNGTVIKTVLRRLRPREVVQSARTSAEIVATQQANIATRMTQVRNGAGNSLAGLQLENHSKNLSPQTLTYLNNNEGSSNANEFISPWGFFMNGQISSGDFSYADANDEGFDFDTKGITAGVDYRLSSRTLIGLAIGYANFDSDIAEDAQMQSTSLTLSAYGSFNINSNFYVDARVSSGQPEFDQSRSINFVIDGQETNTSAIGETDGSQQSVVFSTGYQINANGWQLTPSASLEYSQSKVDQFIESQAGAWNVGFSEQNFETTRLTLGFQANKVISLTNGVLIPSMGYSYINENQDGDDFIKMRVSGMPPGEFFLVETGFNDENYSTAHLGLTFVSSRGKQAFIQYSEVFGWEGFDRSSLNFGARFEF
ncbi:MAG: autotransporter outer membrane beta-barrel domain-containing protein [Marinicellaceae bacterium]